MLTVCQSEVQNYTESDQNLGPFGLWCCGLWVVCFLASCVEMGSQSKPNAQFLAPFSPHSGSGGCQGGPENQHERKDDKVKNSKLFECFEILLKTGGLNGSTFTDVL